MTDAERLCAEELAALDQEIGESCLSRLEILQAETVEKIDRPYRQRVLQLLEDAPELELSRLDPSIQASRLLDDCRCCVGHRQDHQGQDDQQCHERGKVGALPHRVENPPVERREHDGEHDRPEHGAEERPKDPGKHQRYGDDQRKQDAVFKRLHGGDPGLEAPIVASLWAPPQTRTRKNPEGGAFRVASQRRCGPIWPAYANATETLQTRMVTPWGRLASAPSSRPARPAYRRRAPC